MVPDNLAEAALGMIVPVTFNPRDRAQVLIVAKGAQACGVWDEFVKVYLHGRRSWLTWQTLAQRDWQRKTRNPNKARHHDSIAIREKYVTVGMKR